MENTYINTWLRRMLDLLCPHIHIHYERLMMVSYRVLFILALAVTIWWYQNTTIIGKQYNYWAIQNQFCSKVSRKSELWTLIFCNSFPFFDLPWPISCRNVLRGTIYPYHLQKQNEWSIFTHQEMMIKYGWW